MPGIPIYWDNLHPKLVAFVYAKVKDKSVAEDIVQDVFLKAHTRSYQVREGSKVSSWIYQITRNAITDHFRRSSKTLPSVELVPESNGQEFNDCVAVCLRALLMTLPDKYRIALELTESDHLSQLQLAERLKISYPGARSRVQRARKMLREKLDSIYRIETDSYGNIILCENRNPCCCSQVCQ